MGGGYLRESKADVKYGESCGSGESTSPPQAPEAVRLKGQATLDKNTMARPSYWMHTIAFPGGV